MAQIAGPPWPDAVLRRLPAARRPRLTLLQANAYLELLALHESSENFGAERTLTGIGSGGGCGTNNQNY
jgi:hypothetical protein